MRRFITLTVVLALATCWAGAIDSLRPPSSQPTGLDLTAEHRETRWPFVSDPTSAGSHPNETPLTPRADDWLAGIQRDLAKQEYQASANSRGLQAPNRAHNLRTYFEPSGIRVADRTAEGEPELVALRLERVGRTGRLETVTAGALHHEKARVEIRRGSVVEWYENSPEGLEQGFTLDARPEGSGPLVVEIAVQGASAREAGDVATFMSHGGRQLQYGKLAAFDAGGAPLAASMEANDAVVRLLVNDDGATYPITIDPLLTSTHDSQIGFSQAGAWFGNQIACAGDVNGDGYDDVIVGALSFDLGSTNEGAAFIYHGSAAGILNGASPVALLEGNESNAAFAYVAGAGDVNGDGYSDVIVGATGLNAYLGGSAHIFHGSPTGIGNGDPGTAATTVYSSTGGDYFGICTASAGDVNGDGYGDVIVGAYANTGFGKAYVFHGSATGVASGHTFSSAATTLTSTQAAAEFGRSVAGAGDINGDGYDDIVVGAWKFDSGQADEGMVFTWHGSATGIPSGTQGQANDNLQSNQISSFLGYSVGGAGDLNGDGFSDIVVAAQGHDGTQADAGAAYTLHGGPGGISTGVAGSVSRIRFDPGQLNSRVTSVAGAGDVNGDGYGDIIVGCQWYDLPEVDEGVAFVFLGGSSDVQSVTPALAFATLQSDQADARLGSAVAAAGDINGDGYADVMVGAYLWNGAQTDEGMARLYLGGMRGVIGATPTNAAGVMQSDQIGGAPLGMPPYMGASVAGAGDVNGDGYSDVIVGAPYYDWGEPDEGAAFVFLGGGQGVPNGNPANAAAMLQSDQEFVRFGHCVAGAGDVNGDGYADVIVGAPSYYEGTGAGAAFVFLGSPTGVASGNPTGAATILQSDQVGANLGHSVAGAGDVNGDGYADVIAGAPWYTSGETSEGVALVFLGSATGVASGDPFSAATILQSNQALSTFGKSVAGAGDVNGDGYADVIVGADNYDLGSNNEGIALIFLGSASGVANGDPATAATTLQADDTDANLGISVAGAGDVNGDGYADVVVGAHRYGGGDYGAACVFHGSAAGVPSGTPLTAAIRIIQNGPAYQASSVAGAGDVNGDGYSDIIVGQGIDAPVGNAWVYRGGPAGITTATLEIFPQNQGGAKFGVSVAGAGDVNGDGAADVIVGAVGHDSGEMNEGAAFIFIGNGGRSGRPIVPHQARGDGSGVPVQPWGSAGTAGFRAGMTAVDPSGRGRAKVEVEYCPAGQPFGSGSCVREASATWTDAGVWPSPGVVLNHDLSIASPGLYRWRARTLRAPYTVTQAGITAPSNPSHGPWRRMQAQTFAADVRILAAVLAVDTPRDASGLSVAPSMNPARGRITLSAMLPGAEPAELELFDVAGRRLLSERLSPVGSGRHTLQVRGDRELTSGVYLLRLSQGGRTATARVVFIR